MLLRRPDDVNLRSLLETATDQGRRHVIAQEWVAPEARTAESSWYHQLLRNGSGQVVAPGDSGGPGFLWDNGTPYIVGINSGGGCGSPDAFQVSLPAVRDWITAVLNTGWTPGLRRSST